MILPNEIIVLKQFHGADYNRHVEELQDGSGLTVNRIKKNSKKANVGEILNLQVVILVNRSSLSPLFQPSFCMQ